jgi:hypothetical protein
MYRESREVPSVTPPSETMSQNDMVETTFHLAEHYGRPFQWVGRITTPDMTWSSGQEDGQELEPITVDLPADMVTPMLAFARRHIGPNATEQQTSYWCHHFAYDVGSTALEMTGEVMGGVQGLADAQAGHVFTHGSEIPADGLTVGEHAAVGDKTVSAMPVHSMVGIGRAKNAMNDAMLAVQVDRPNGDLYVGDPAAYMHDLQSSRSQVGLYVQRTPLWLPAAGK